MRIATWNVNSIRSRMPQFVRWVQDARPDVICLQETKVADDLFPAGPLREAGFPHQAIHGQKTYNGVAILSRLPIEGATAGLGDPALNVQARILRATVGGVRLACCYAPSGQAVGSDKFAYKLSWFEGLQRLLGRDEDPSRPLLLCGDLNVAPEEPDVWDPVACEGEVLFHPDERAAFRRLIAWGFADAWRTRHPEAREFSWFDYRAGAFPRNRGFRIDHALATPALLARVTDAALWREPRTWEKPSDHLPLTVDVAG